MAATTTRRRFLQATAALALPATIGLRNVLADETSKPRFTLGFSLYGMNALPLDAAIRECAAIGFRDIEPALMANYSAEPAKLTKPRRAELRRLIGDSGLAVPAVMENIAAVAADDAHRNNLERIARAAELAHDLMPETSPASAAPAIMETVLGGKPADWEKLRRPMVERLGQWAETAERHDLTIAVKPHVGGALHTPEDAAWLVEQTASPRIRLVYDYSHFQLQGFDLEKSLRLLLPHTAFIHVKDGRGMPGKFQFLLPGEGTTDYVAYFRLLTELGYAGSVTVEVSGMIHQKPEYDALAAARKCYRTLSAAFREV